MKRWQDVLSRLAVKRRAKHSARTEAPRQTLIAGTETTMAHQTLSGNRLDMRQ
jgi:hypothetical protein